MIFNVRIGTASAQEYTYQVEADTIDKADLQAVLTHNTIVEGEGELIVWMATSVKEQP